ncbi:CPBP family intramembrane glutamic endopeptidase [Flavobacterium sp.]|uniref:CPBP family intramembrane glutamic endopeptidase n=1 Tax=Flavobacterium sp. TaxID=239 RepID=UPI00375327C1
MQATNSLLYVISYVLFFGFSWMCKIKGIHRLINDDGVFTKKPKGLINAHIIGAIWLGLVPVIFLKQSIFKVLTEIKIPVSFIIVLFFFVLILIITIAFEQSRKAYEKSQSSSESFARLSSKFFNSYFIVRALFLFSYELWFRGFLLFGCIHRFGIPLAIFINVTVYVFLHIFNGKNEALACIPFGLLVCFFSIIFNSALAAIMLHMGFSLAYEINIYRLNLINSKTAKS